MKFVLFSNNKKKLQKYIPTPRTQTNLHTYDERMHVILHFFLLKLLRFKKNLLNIFSFNSARNLNKYTTIKISLTT